MENSHELVVLDLICNQYEKIFSEKKFDELKLVNAFIGKYGLRRTAGLIKDTKQSYKIINDWTRLGIIDDNREKDGNWRKFNVFDLFWIRLVAKLREFNLPLDDIKVIKKEVYDPIEKDMSALNFYFVMHTMFKHLRIKTYLVFYDDKQSKIAFLSENLIDEMGTKSATILINMDQIFDLKNGMDQINANLISTSELITETINKKDFENLEKVILHLNEGLIDRIETEENVDPKNSFGDVKNSHDYQTITTNIHKGGVNQIKVKKSYKISSKDNGIVKH